MKIYNSLTRSLESFHPQNDEIGMYVCGPTVYDIGHLGHARSAVAFDVIRRYLQSWKNWKVCFVSNFTDVDDKMINRARDEGITEFELAKRIIPEYDKDYGALKILPPTHQPRATEYVPRMVSLVERLLNKGFAYITEDGIYFEVRKFPNYGKLSSQKLDELQAGARIEVDDKKRNPEDFALWKAEKPGEPAWEGPHGMRGRPGWHIECSAMSRELLGETFDIHGGGIDLIFPHHECEVAQSEAAWGRPFARFWLHNGHVKINKEKMSKSLGNFFTIKDILKEHNSAVVRFFLLSTHYRMPIDFSRALLEQAKNGLERLRDCVRAVVRIVEGPEDNDTNVFLQDDINRAAHDFEKAMDDDFNISSALGAVFDFVEEVNRNLKDISKQEAELCFSFFEKVDSVLAVLIEKSTVLSEQIELLIDARNLARNNKDFARADKIRKELLAQGIILEDTPSGTVWKKALL